MASFRLCLTASMGRDMRIVGYSVASGVLLSTTDTDAAGCGDVARGLTRCDPEPAAGDEIGTMQVETDSERLAELAWARAEEPFSVKSATDAHQVYADHRLERADQHRAGGARR